jgi:hypothetical protein
VALAVAALGCKKPVGTTDEVTVVSTTPLQIPSSAPPTVTGIVNPGMADLTPPVTGNPGVVGGSASNPFASPITPLPAKLPRDPGGAPQLKIVPMKITFAAGRTVDGAAELKSDGTLLFDGTRSGKMVGNKITLKKAPIAVALRSDGFITVASPKGTFFKRDAVGVTSQTGYRFRVGADNASIVSDTPDGGQVTYGQVNIPLLDDASKTTALMTVVTEVTHIPDAVLQLAGAPKSNGNAGGLPLPPGFPSGNFSFGEAPTTQ